MLGLGSRPPLPGPCFRCLADAELPLSPALREYQAPNPGGDDELRTEYLDDDRLDTPGYQTAQGWRPATGTGIAGDLEATFQAPLRGP